ncbi:hypothetical protein [Pseudochrobactrum sp. XF203]|nr:hypothetical protein [Pseudochrobactrum sp. XF203]
MPDTGLRILAMPQEISVMRFKRLHAFCLQFAAVKQDIRKE